LEVKGSAKHEKQKREEGERVKIPTSLVFIELARAAFTDPSNSRKKQMDSSLWVERGKKR